MNDVVDMLNSPYSCSILTAALSYFGHDSQKGVFIEELGEEFIAWAAFFEYSLEYSKIREDVRKSRFAFYIHQDFEEARRTWLDEFADLCITSKSMSLIYGFPFLINKNGNPSNDLDLASIAVAYGRAERTRLSKESFGLLVMEYLAKRWDKQKTVKTSTEKQLLAAIENKLNRLENTLNAN